MEARKNSFGCFRPNHTPRHFTLFEAFRIDFIAYKILIGMTHFNDNNSSQRGIAGEFAVSTLRKMLRRFHEGSGFLMIIGSLFFCQTMLAK